jgi:hypothetical protein
MAKKLTSTKAKQILHDKEVHGHPLTDKQRKFFGAISGGAKPYSNAQMGTLLQPITMEDVSNFFQLFSVPQKAATKLITGKYQTPSEAMGIKNKVGAFATDMILDPVNLLGAGLAGKAAKATKAAKTTSSVAKKAKPNFKSEIDWGKWNKEIPENKALMQEYNAIEQQAKNTGTWMKNPDGSPFQGTPEQFVVQQSSNFKRAFPEYYGEKLNHNSPNKFDEISNEYFGTTSDRGWYGEGLYAHPEKEYTSIFGDNNYEFYVNSKNKGIINKENYNASKAYQRNYDLEFEKLNKEKQLTLQEIKNNPKEYTDFEFWNKIINNQYDRKLNSLLKEQQEGIKHNINQYTTLTNPQNGEVVIPFNNRIKSAIGNNGMFDMTNPNIYKALVPAAIATGALQEKKNGGWLNAYEDVPKAQEGIKAFGSVKERDDYRKKFTDVAKTALTNTADDSEYLLSTSYHNIDDGENCINGICGLNLRAGFKYNAPTDVDRYLGSTKFSDAVKQGKEDYYLASGNFNVGDHIQYLDSKGKPGHNKIIYDVTENEYGDKQYHIIHNSGGKEFKGEVYSESDLKNMLRGESPHLFNYSRVNVYRPGYSLDKELLTKERKAKTPLEARNAIKQRKRNLQYQEEFNPGYQYSVREDSELYGNEPEGVKEFLKLANDDTRVTDIIKRLDKAGLASKADKLSVHNSLLNVFGILGQENKFENRLFGGDFGVENLIERNIYDGLIPTPGAEGNLSIGPGQIKFSSINPEIRKAFGIKKPKDLYNWDKVLPLMVGMDISNRKWMENQGKKLSERIIGEPGAGSTDMIWDEARMSPYFWQGPGIPNLREFLSKKYDEYVEGYRIPKKVKEAQREEYISKNIRKYQKVFDPESYGQKVYENINKNLQRTSPNLEKEQTLQEIVIPIKKKKQNGGWLNKYEVPEAQNGIEGTMGGLTDVGFDYNGAWGGTMAMGGSLPGSVGFTYAREGAPSNGPYAKKTKASAQNGMEMKYYQEGLDFQPKTISRDGSDIIKDDMGYWNPENWGKPVEIDSNKITMQGVYEPLLGVSDTGDTQMMYPGEDYTFDGESVTEYPVARRGTSVNNADAQPIKKLNQLMDFSNYNKPTKGGWLSKYE